MSKVVTHVLSYEGDKWKLMYLSTTHGTLNDFQLNIVQDISYQENNEE